MTPIHTITPSDEIKAVYEPLDELTQHEIEKLLTYARAVKRGEAKRGMFELAHGKSNELYIEACKRVSFPFKDL